MGGREIDPSGYPPQSRQVAGRCRRGSGIEGPGVRGRPPVTATGSRIGKHAQVWSRGMNPGSITAAAARSIGSAPPARV